MDSNCLMVPWKAWWSQPQVSKISNDSPKCHTGLCMNFNTKDVTTEIAASMQTKQQ